MANKLIMFIFTVLIILLKIQNIKATNKDWSFEHKVKDKIFYVDDSLGI